MPTGYGRSELRQWIREVMMTKETETMTEEFKVGDEVRVAYNFRQIEYAIHTNSEMSKYKNKVLYIRTKFNNRYILTEITQNIGKQVYETAHEPLQEWVWTDDMLMKPCPSVLDKMVKVNIRRIQHEKI